MIDSFQGKYRFLRNFWITSPYTIDVIFKSYRVFSYPSVEHAYQVSKSTELADYIAVQQIQKPGDAKIYGRTIQIRKDWESIKCAVMLDFVRQKFQEPFLRKMLLSTGDQELIEGNHWHDNVWGICSCDKCRAKYYGENSAKNWLGRILMQVRQEIQ